MPDSSPNLILLGHVAGAHGIRGEVSVKTYTGVPGDIGSYGPLSDKTGTRTFTLKVVRVTPKGVVIASIKNVDNRNKAESLRGTALYVARKKLPPTADAEFYHADLIGLIAVDPVGKPIGRVASMQNFGAGDLLELAFDYGGKTEFIPFTLTVVPEIDIAGGRIVVVLPSATEATEDPDRPIDP